MKRIFVPFLAFLILSIASCKHSQKSDHDLLTSNDVRVAIDATLQPIMEEELEQFGLTYPAATVLPLYCSEDSAIQLLVTDSLRTIVATRKLTAAQKQHIEAAGHNASQALIAYDAFALIVNKENPDTLITLNEIKGIVTGKITHWNQLKTHHSNDKISLVFDNSGSSTVRYMRDSLCSGQPLQGNIYAQGDNLSVIDVVKNRKDVIGVVGTDWLRSPKGEALNSFKDLNVKVMLVAKDDTEYPEYTRPYQLNIGLGKYPLVRSVWVITTDPRTSSYEHKLYYWLKGQRGQQIICNNSQLLPNVPVQVRDVQIVK